MPQPAAIFKCLSDETRLRTLLLIFAEGELCVCEIAAALDLSQPKISRHLSQLRGYQLLQDSRHGQWVYYQLHPQLDGWIHNLLTLTASAHPNQIDLDQARLKQMGERPERQAICC